jgi:hypothetical protein
MGAGWGDCLRPLSGGRLRSSFQSNSAFVCTSLQDSCPEVLGESCSHSEELACLDTQLEEGMDVGDGLGTNKGGRYVVSGLDGRKRTDSVGSIHVILNAQYVPSLLCYEWFNEASLPDIIYDIIFDVISNII